MDKTALISPCGAYRFRLGRRWSAEQCVLWVMLNPSTADSEQDDPTIRRCILFARDWGYGAILVGNLFALRATDPNDLQRHPEPWGIGNTLHLRQMAIESDLVVAAWGANRMVSELHADSVMGNLDDRPIKCLGRTKNGAPRHPLYVAARTQLIDYG